MDYWYLKQKLKLTVLVLVYVGIKNSPFQCHRERRANAVTKLEELGELDIPKAEIFINVINKPAFTKW